MTLGQRLSLEDAREAFAKAEAMLMKAGKYALANRACAMKGEVAMELAKLYREVRP